MHVWLIWCIELKSNNSRKRERDARAIRGVGPWSIIDRRRRRRRRSARGQVDAALATVAHKAPPPQCWTVVMKTRQHTHKRSAIQVPRRIIQHAQRPLAALKRI